MSSFLPTQSFAAQLDEQDPLKDYRSQFHFPTGRDGQDCLYFTGNSLGLQPHTARHYVDEEMKHWATLGVRGHFVPDRAWTTYHETLSESMARVVGANPDEVVIMNTLTVNLHLMLVSFYRPTPRRFKILMESDTFPSDRYAVSSFLEHLGKDPSETIINISPKPGSVNLNPSDVIEVIQEVGDELALVLLGNPNYYTGQSFDMKSITEASHQVGALVGFDCAHGAGNLTLDLHESGVDWAIWCTYK